MKAFRFTLEPALRWRSALHAQEEEKLKRLLANLKALERQLLDVQTAKRDATRTSFGSEPVMGSDFQIVARYLLGLQSRQNELRVALAETTREVQTQKAKCLEAQRHVELLSSLRDKRFQTWRREQELELESLAAEAYLAKRAREG